jgi:hypothetical protein
MTRSRSRPAGSPARCTVTACRGCCCGNPGKNPHIDHAEQLDRLRQDLADTARLRLSDCLGVCEQSNVIVIQPSATGRAAGGRPLWLGLVLDLEVIDDITTWITAGGPGLAETPDVLGLYEFQPSRRIRKDAGFDETAGV